MKLRWGRIAKLSIIGIAFALVSLVIGFSWRYVHGLTAPVCNARPAKLVNFPIPEQIQLHTQDGHMLYAWYYPTKNGAAVLALGGIGGSLGDNLPPVGALLHSGYGVLQIDTRACAQPPGRVTLGYQEALDAQAGLAFLLTRPEVDPERIGAFGYSMGGVAAFRAAARNQEISAIVAEGGYFNLGEDIVDADQPQPLLRRAILYSIAAAFWVQTGVNPWESSPIDDLPLISPRPVLLIYGENEIGDGRALRQFSAAGEPKELWVVPGGDHGSNHLVAEGEYNRRVVVFFERVLAGGDTTSP